MPRRTIQRSETLRTVVAEEIARLGVHADLNHLDLSDVVDMSRAFEDVDFQGNISQWDVSGVADMGHLFARSSFNGDISKWNVSHARSMVSIFDESAFKGDISAWDTARVIHMHRAFHKSRFNGDLSKWDVQNVQNFEDMFRESAFAGDISTWKFANVINVNFMFYDCPWRGIPGNLRYRPGLEFSAFFEPAVAMEFEQPNFYHWFMAMTGHKNLRDEWRMLAALAPTCTDIKDQVETSVLLQTWWEQGTRATPRETYPHEFESSFPL